MEQRKLLPDPLMDLGKGDEQRLNYDFPADAVARQYLVDMGEGLVGSTPFAIWSFVDVKCRPHLYRQEWGGSSTPNIKFAVHAACAHFLAGATPLSTPQTPAKTVCYVFRNGNRLLAAIWSSNPNQKISAKIVPPEKATVIVYNMLANEIMNTSTSFALPLCAEPFYMEWQNATEQTVSAALSNATFDPVEVSHLP